MMNKIFVLIISIIIFIVLLDYYKQKIENDFKIKLVEEIFGKEEFTSLTDIYSNKNLDTINKIQAFNQNNLQHNTFIDLKKNLDMSYSYLAVNDLQVNSETNMCIHNKIELPNINLTNLDNTYFPPNSIILFSNKNLSEKDNDEALKILSKITDTEVIIIMHRLPNNLYSFKLVEKINLPINPNQNKSYYIISK